nr:hypothetical protein [Paenibacillus xylanexedens]
MKLFFFNKIDYVFRYGLDDAQLQAGRFFDVESSNKTFTKVQKMNTISIRGWADFQ